jgi:hypothetical protein
MNNINLKYLILFSIYVYMYVCMYVSYFVVFLFSFLLKYTVEHSEGIISVINEPRLPVGNSPSCSQDDFPAYENEKEGIRDVNGNGNKTSEHSESMKHKLRRILTPNPEDAVLPNLYGNRGAVEVLPDDLPQTPSNSLLNLTKAISSHDLKILAFCQNNSGSNMNLKSQSNLDLRMSGDFNADCVGEDSSFIFECRNSKHLANMDFGGRIVEGLFVESPLIKNGSSAGKSGLRKIALSQSLQNMESHPGEDSHIPDENSPSTPETQDNQDSLSKFEERLNYANSNINTIFERVSQASDIQNTIILSVEIHNKQRETNTQNQPESGECQLKTFSESGTNICNNNSKDSEGVELARGPVLLLDPITLQHQIPSRGCPSINPDGSMEICQGWSLLHPW